VHDKSLRAGIVFALAISVVGLLVWNPPRGVASTELPQSEIVARAIAQARAGLHTGRLDTEPTKTTARRMTLGEFRARLDPNGQDPQDSNTTVWLVVFEGRTVIEQPIAQQNPVPPIVNNDMWVLLSTTGGVIAWGSQGPGNELDLDAPAPVAVPGVPTSPIEEPTPGPTATPAPRR
jgi:hypothetical protein